MYGAFPVDYSAEDATWPMDDKSVLVKVMAWCSKYILFFKITFECQGLTHWGQVTYVCVNKLNIIGSDNGLAPGQHQAII